MPSRAVLDVQALPLLPAPPARAAGHCRACDALLGAFAPARGRDSLRDDAAFFLDGFCSHACYHAYGARVAGRAAVARWN